MSILKGHLRRSCCVVGKMHDFTGNLRWSSGVVERIFCLRRNMRRSSGVDLRREGNSISVSLMSTILHVYNAEVVCVLSASSNILNF